MNDLRDLKALIRAVTPIIAIETMEETRALRLLDELAREFDRPLYRWSAASGLTQPGFRYGAAAPAGQGPGRPDLSLQDDWRDTTERGPDGERVVPDTQSPVSALKFIGQRGQRGLYVLLDLQRHLEDPVVLRQLREIALDHPVDQRTLVLVGPQVNLPPKLARHTAHMRLSLPEEARIREILGEEIALFERDGDRVKRTPAVEDALVRYASGLCEEDVRLLMRQSVRNDGALTHDDLLRAAKYKQQTTPGLTLETAPENPASIGGLLRLRRWLNQRRPIFLGEVARPGLPHPKGVLITGVQGTGKSLAAKVTAAEWGVPLVRLDIGSLYDKYHGETERKLRDALAAAEGMQPIVLWIDEIEKGLSADASGGDGGVSRRVLGTLLTWMAERSSRIFIVATANEVHALPPELVRKGRFDELFFVDLPDPPARETIFRIHLSRHRLPLDGFDLRTLAERSPGLSGAEIEQAIVSMLYEALPDNRSPDMDMLLAELARTRPLSVIMAEKVAQLRAWATERCVMAD